MYPPCQTTHRPTHTGLVTRESCRADVGFWSLKNMDRVQLFIYINYIYPNEKKVSTINTRSKYEFQKLKNEINIQIFKKFVPETTSVFWF